MNKKIFYWDTTLDPIDYPNKIRKKFFYLSLKNRKRFVNWLGKISYKYHNQLSWWIKLPSSRDPNKSNLFKNIIILKVLHDIKIKNEKLFLKVDTKEFKNTIYRNINKKKIEKIEIKQKNYKGSFFLIKNIIYFLFTYSVVNFFTKKKDISTLDKVTLIDTFVDHRKGNDDVIYPNLQKFIMKKHSKNIFFVPTFIINRNLLNTFQRIRVFSKKNYLFKENYLSLSDITNSLFEILFKKNFDENFKKYDRIDCSSILKQELNSKKDFYSELVSKLNFLFIKKLKKENLNIKKSINRFENQSVDRAWNLGFRTFFPKAEILGYQGNLYYPQQPHQTPTFYEEKAKVIPNKIIVTSKYFKKPRQEFYKNLKVIVGPSIEKQDIFKKTKINHHYKYVLALSGIYSLDKKLLEWTIYALKKNKKLKVILKPHPILPIDKIIDTKSDIFKGQLKISNENIKNILEKTQILISSGPTGILLESLVYGCKLFYLFIDPSDILLLKNIPISKSMYELINGEKELLNKMNKFHSKKIRKKSNNLKELLYTRTNTKNVQLFV